MLKSLDWRAYFSALSDVIVPGHGFPGPTLFVLKPAKFIEQSRHACLHQRELSSVFCAALSESP